MEDFLSASAFGIAQFFMLLGLFGLIVPLFPGTVVMWLTALIYGIVNGFGTLGIVMMILITLLMLASTAVDNLMMGAGARQAGASWRTVLLAIAAGVLGTIFFPPFGGLLAAPLSVLALEYYRLRDWSKAWRALRGMLTGWGLSFVVRFVIGIFMMCLWWIWVWKG